jgi:alpha-tubulin suppressor-like RCC1 family protein
MGSDHSCALLLNGSVVCWGSNRSGQLGNGSTTASSSPVVVQGISGATALSAMSVATCALVGSGVLCWGDNENGELGNGSTADHSTTPVSVSNLGNVTALAMSGGEFHECVLSSDGSVHCWGANQVGQLGNGTTTGSFTPVLVEGLTNPTAVVTGGDTTCAVDGSALKCWGTILGDSTMAESSMPVAVSGGLTSIARVAPGLLDTCALLATGASFCWGDNSGGQFGTGTTTSSPTPVATGLPAAVEIAVNNNVTCAIAVDGSVWCAGANGYGQLGNDTTINSSVPVQVAPW